MAEIVWTSSALKDLNEIGEYIATDSPRYAEITIDKLFNKVEILRNHHRLGRIVPEADQENIRELIEGNYRIIYEIINDSLFVLTVHHSSRMLRL